MATKTPPAKVLKYKKGDTVRLKSDGPVMTIQTYNLMQDKYIAQWFAGKKLEQGFFSEESLIAALPPAPATPATS